MKRPIAHLAGVGRYAPSRVMTNAEFAVLGLETNDEWIVQRTGIRERRYIEESGIGASDLALVADAAGAAERIRPQLPTGVRVFSSPLQRCHQLAALLHPAPVNDDRLREMHFGAWGMTPWQRIQRTALDGWAADPLGFRAPGGESPREMAARVLAWLEEHGVAARTPDAGSESVLAPKAEIAKAEACPPSPEDPAHLVVVAHGGPLRVLAGYLLGMPPERWIGLDFGCGQVTRIDVESWGTVLKWFNR